MHSPQLSCHSPLLPLQPSPLVFPDQYWPPQQYLWGIAEVFWGKHCHSSLNYVWWLPHCFTLPWGQTDATSSTPRQYWSGLHFLTWRREWLHFICHTYGFTFPLLLPSSSSSSFFSPFRKEKTLQIRRTPTVLQELFLVRREETVSSTPKELYSQFPGLIANYWIQDFFCLLQSSCACQETHKSLL